MPEGKQDRYVWGRIKIRKGHILLSDEKIYIRDISGYIRDGAEKYEERLKLLPEWRYEKAMRFKFHPDRVRCAESYLLLMEGLGSGEQAERICREGFFYGTNKKPYLPGESRLFFNLSHSGDRVMCIISGAECGCDVEQIKDSRDAIVRRFFHEKEKEFIDAGEDTVRSFYKVWTLKESAMKACGEGMALAMDSFCVTEGLEPVRCSGGSGTNGAEAVKFSISAGEGRTLVLKGREYTVGSFCEEGYFYGWCVENGEEKSHSATVLWYN